MALTEVLLGSIARIIDCEHKTAPISKNEIYAYSVGTRALSQNFIDVTYCKPVDKETYQTWSKRAEIEPGDIVLAREAPVGGVGLVKSSNPLFCLGQRTVLIKPDRNHINPLFLNYLLRSDEIQKWFADMSTGSTVLHINVGDIKTLPLKELPNLQNQAVIADILQNLELRIDSNKRIARQLEEIAQTIFKSWFIDFDPVKAKVAGEKPVGMDDATAALFPDSLEGSELGPIPAGWNVKSLDAIASRRKENVGIDDLSEDDVYVGLDSIPRKSLFFNEWESAAGVQSGKTRFQSHDILFGKLRPYFHKISIAPVNGVCSTDVVVIYVERVELLPYVACLVNQSTFVDFLSHRSTGTRMPRTSWKEMCEFRIACPPDVVLKEFGKFMLGSFEQCIKLQLQVRTLIELRDSLLPRLISGELQIPEEMLVS
jgi:type I restriction enzyme S subunit